ncbi:MAG: ABC transporter permease [Chloroflexi bacterium]|nr:ABC transporter permease [Chloroflexota bacterium]
MAVAAQPQKQPIVINSIDDVLARPPRSLWGDAFIRLRRNKAAMAAIGIIALFYVLAIFADRIAPYGYNQQFQTETQKRPVWMTRSDPRFLLGTDGIGRDVVSRAIYSAQVSMAIGLIPISLYLLIGGTIGMTAGFLGGRTDNLLMRITDIVYAFPGLLFLIIMGVAFRDSWLGEQMHGLVLVFVSLAIVGWEGMARLVRGQVLQAKEKEYVEAARMIGASNTRIMTRHIVPNILAPLIVSMAFSVPGAIMAEAGLSFLGLGIKGPFPSWGSMIVDGQQAIFSQPGIVILPAVCIALIMLSFTFLGDGLRDALDPRMKQ